VQAACEDSAWLNVLQYMVPLAAMWWGFSQIFRQKVSRLYKTRLAKAAPLWTGAA
jgi:lipopolysaccharide export system permease protein